MKSKFTFAIALLCISLSLKAQITQTCYSETFNSPAGWNYSQGASVSSYTNPIGCAANMGIVTPGIGGNNPANVFTPNFTSTGALTLQMSFDIFCVSSNLACNSWKDFGCPTSIDVFYHVGATRYTGLTDLVLPSNGPTNSPTVSFSFPVGNTLPAGTVYKVEIAFKPKSGIGSCGQPGTKYILDNYKKCEITCVNCVVDATNDNFCDQASGDTFTGNLSTNDFRYQGANVTYSLANGPFANGSSTTGGATLVINPNGTFTITRTDPSKSTFDFTYRVTDNLLGYSDLASVTVCFPMGGSVLPVVFTDIVANRKGDQAVISWKTSTEINSDKFEVERLVNNKFVKAGTVAASNNINGSTYSFSEKNVATASTQYRIKIIDRDQKAGYSVIKTVKGMGAAMDFMLYPNPSNGASSLSVTDITGQVSIQLIDNLGRIVRTSETNNNSKINIKGLDKGMYVVLMTSQTTGEKVAKKLIIN